MILKAIDKYAGGVFSPDDVRILVAAFDGAWRSLVASGMILESDRESEAARDTLAKHIIEQARYGERDQGRLRDGALLQYAQSKLTRANEALAPSGRRLASYPTAASKTLHKVDLARCLATLVAKQTCRERRRRIGRLRMSHTD